MITEAQFAEWRDGLPPDQKAAVERVHRTDVRLAYKLYPHPPGPPDTSICIHEAGHAAAMHAFGIRVDHTFAKDSHGAVLPAPHDPSKPYNWIALGVMVLAGDMAEPERTLTQADWRETVEGKRADATSDEKAAIIFAIALAGFDAGTEELLSRIVQFWNVAVDMFAAPGFWPSVYAVSAILRRDGRIEGEQVHELCEQHLPFGSLVHLTQDIK